MHFEITSSQQAVRKALTSAQRNSSLFSEAPRIGGVTLRRGQVLKYDQDQFKAQEVMLKRLFDAGAIEISQVDGDQRRDLRQEQAQLSDVKAELQNVPVAPPPSAPVPHVITIAPEPVKNEAFPTPEELMAAVATENKETAAQIETAGETALSPVETVEAVAPVAAPVEDMTPVVPPPSAPHAAPAHHAEKHSKKRSK